MKDRKKFRIHEWYYVIFVQDKHLLTFNIKLHTMNLKRNLNFIMIIFCFIQSEIYETARFRHCHRLFYTRKWILIKKCKDILEVRIICWKLLFGWHDIFIIKTKIYKNLKLNSVNNCATYWLIGPIQCSKNK